MTAMLTGRLVDRGGCLWVLPERGDSYPVIWPYGYTWSVENNTTQVHDETGEIVARVGDDIVMGGGEVPFDEQPGNECLKASKVWLASGPIQTTAAAAAPTSSPAPPDIVFPKATTPSDGGGELIGTLVEYNGCLRVEARDGTASYLIIWPSDVYPRHELNSILLDDGAGLPVGSMGIEHYRGWVGADLYLTGEVVTDPHAETSIAEPLAADCAGPYWFAGSDIRLAEFVALDGQPALLNPNDGTLVGAMQFAVQYRITLAEQIHRAALIEPLGAIVGALAANERETLAGLWVEHEPEFKIIAWFTRDGETTLQLYVAGTALESIIEVRNGARWTEDELDKQHEDTLRIMQDLEIRTESLIDVSENRIELYVADREAVEATLEAAGVQLPEAVLLIDID